MDNGWRMFWTDQGLESLENPALDERGFYRMKVFLKNYFRNRYREKEDMTVSVLWKIVMNLQGKKEKPVTSEEQDNYVHEFYVDGNRLILTWNPCEGVAMLAEDVKSNPILEELKNRFAQQEIWWCQGAAS